MKLARFAKQPAERKRYTIDYSDWLDTGETISSVAFVVSPTGLQVDAYSIAASGTSVVFFANYGVNGTAYTVTATITTSGGQIKEDEILFAVRES